MTIVQYPINTKPPQRICIMRTHHLYRSLAAKLLAAAALCAASLPSHAGWTCTGHVRDLTVDPGGVLTISLFKPDGTMVWQFKNLCSLNGTFNSLTPAACKGVHNTLVLSVALKRTVTFWFDYANTRTADCSPTAFPAWQTLTANSDNWYFGPKLDE
jgi:hypothetical protein